MMASTLRSLIRRQAVAQGFKDPGEILETLGRFSEPSEVAYPVELLRAGATMHARGLYNSAILQYNLDWKWPYWVNRQFDPACKSFIPRAFSLTHINLTHRNWVAVGLPETAAYPLVDPAGMLTPHWDGWSLDVWVCDDGGHWRTAEDAVSIEQRLEFGEGLAVLTTLNFTGCSIVIRVHAAVAEQGPVCQLRCSVEAGTAGALALAVRPANPEGVSFVHAIERAREDCGLMVDGTLLHFDQAPSTWMFSDYRQGDVFQQLHKHMQGEEQDANGRSCPHGMATAAAIFAGGNGVAEPVTCSMPLSKPDQGAGHATALDWQQALAGACRFQLPDPHFQYLTTAALHTLVLLAPGEVYPGSFTYKRFWFRDATYMVSALLAAGLVARARRVLDAFIRRQLPSGYFRSQEGEWDSNGQVLWIFAHYFAVTGTTPERKLLDKLILGGEWIRNKCLRTRTGHAHPGLLPAGFSAEHLGPNDYYYWDDFWSVAGLQALASLCAKCGDTRRQQSFNLQAQDMLRAIETSLEHARARHERAAMPAAPLRRLDAAVIGSLVASYPLRLFAGDDERLQDSVAFLKQNCLVHGAFYQEMIHSGINAYLTLHLAQAALRAGDADHFALVSRIAALASPTGQWPEAIHPGTGGGCMGDGQHGWAAAEWLLMMRNLFIREEEQGLILASGIPAQWLRPGNVLACQASPVEGGLASLELRARHDDVELRWSIEWQREPRPLHVRLAGFPGHTTLQPSGSLTLARQ